MARTPRKNKSGAFEILIRLVKNKHKHFFIIDVIINNRVKGMVKNRHLFSYMG
jgi:hypothetical protein